MTKRISLRTLFCIISAVAVLLAMVSWRLRQHVEWTRLERELENESVRFDGRQQFDRGWPAILGVNSFHPTGALIDANTRDASRLAELPTLERIIIFGTEDGTPWRAKLPSNVSAKQLSQWRSVPLEVDRVIARWGTIEVAKFIDKDWSVESARAVAQSPSICTLVCDIYHDHSVDDRVALELLQLPTLTNFSVGSQRVTDATIDRLAQKPQLKRISLDSTRITPARVEWLRKALPDAQVTIVRDD